MDNKLSLLFVSLAFTVVTLKMEENNEQDID